jgi:hypothetical protein
MIAHGFLPNTAQWDRAADEVACPQVAVFADH